jgi:two-component system cell cycle sensor histidine kinase/response regulator CckA
MAADKPKVLVMDDEEAVRRVAQLFLTRLGYEPVMVADGQAALAVYRAAVAAGQGFAAVILDLTVPAGWGGLATARELLTVDAAARLVVASGNPQDEAMADHARHGFCAAVAKPFDLTTFSRAVAAAAGGAGGRGPA